MKSPEDLTRDFYAFERRGRGWDTYPEVVHLEPELVPIPTRHAPDLASMACADDLPSQTRCCFRLAFGDEYQGELRDTIGWLSTLSTIGHPVAVELLRIGGETSLTYSLVPEDRLFLASRDTPGLRLEETPDLPERLMDLPEGVTRLHGFGLLREWMLPVGRMPILGGLVSLFNALEEGEAAVFQVLFEPTRGPFREAGSFAIRTSRGLPFFRDRPDFEEKIDGKLDEPLFSVVIRTCAAALSAARLEEIGAALLGHFATPMSANSFVPLSIDPRVEARGLIERTTHRTGMLLSASELAALIHPPKGLTLGVPQVIPETLSRGTMVLGKVKYEGAYRPVRVATQTRLMHTHIVGASGSGKSTLLLQMMLNDASYPGGFALLDPHGDLADQLLLHLPEDRLADVVLFDPADPDYVLGFNPLAARTPAEREILSSDLVAVFKRLATSWGDQMTTVLSYAILGVLSGGGGTLHDLLRFLSNKAVRDEFLDRSDDPYVRAFFKDEFGRLRGRPETSILTRLHGLLRVPLLREVLLEEQASVNLEEILASGKIFIARLSKGAIGAENAALLGSLLITRTFMAALLRESLPTERRSPFFLYIDEVHEVMSPSLSEIFSGARKFGLGAIVSHQSLSQLSATERETLKSLLANAFTRVIFRVGEEDARFLSRGLSGISEDALVNLDVGEAIVRAGRGIDTLEIETLPPFAPPRSPDELPDVKRQILTRSARERGSPQAPLSASRSEALPQETPQVQETPEAPQAAREELAEPDFQPKAAPTPKNEKTPGHGGPEHRYLQGMVSEWGKSRGFKVTLEEPILEGAGRVDVSLRKESRTLAVEIAVTTDPAHEVGNIRKCLKADFDEVIVVSTNERLLATLKEMYGEHTQVHLFAPPDLFAFLENEPTEAGTVAGYRVSVAYEGESLRSASPVREVLMRNLKRLRRRT